MSFHITIKEVTREQVKTREYAQIDTDENGEAEYGYVNNEKTEDVERVVYTQQVENLDIVNVINAVNEPSQMDMLQTAPPVTVKSKGE